VEPEPLPGIDLLGHETHSMDAVQIEVIATASEGLKRVMDLEFNPLVAGELWTISSQNDSVTILHGGDGSEPEYETIIDPYAMHFMDSPSAISFADNGFFGTTQESANTYNGMAAPNYYMGPTLWKSDLDIFGHSNPDAVEYLSDLYGFYADLGAHYDMLHDSPLATGIVWSHDNVYWVFDGYHEAVSRQDFVEDHGMGWDEHEDGEILRYGSGQFSRAEGVHSGMSLDSDTGMLYIADSGNGRVVVLDTASGTMGARAEGASNVGTWEYNQYPVHNLMDGADIQTLVGEGLTTPSGLVRYNDHLVVADHGTGIVHAYTLEGVEVDYLDTGLGSGIQGIRIGPDGNLYVAHSVNNEVLRISPNSGYFEDADEAR